MGDVGRWGWICLLLFRANCPQEVGGMELHAQEPFEILETPLTSVSKQGGPDARCIIASDC